jgi:hypothetical protein
LGQTAERLALFIHPQHTLVLYSPCGKPPQCVEGEAKLVGCVTEIDGAPWLLDTKRGYGLPLADLTTATRLGIASLESTYPMEKAA